MVAGVHELFDHMGTLPRNGAKSRWNRIKAHTTRNNMSKTTEKNLLSECKLWLLYHTRPLVNRETCEQNNGRKLNRS